MSLIKDKQPTAPQRVFASVTRKALRANPNTKAVAEELKIDRATVYRHAKGMDLRLIRSFKDLDLSVKDMVRFIAHEMNQSNASVAEKLGVTQAYVSEVLNEN